MVKKSINNHVKQLCTVLIHIRSFDAFSKLHTKVANNGKNTFQQHRKNPGVKSNTLGGNRGSITTKSVRGRHTPNGS